jgi:hypothetical protein
MVRTPWLQGSAGFVVVYFDDSQILLAGGLERHGGADGVTAVILENLFGLGCEL